MNEVLNLIDDSVYVHCNRKKTELARSVMDKIRGKINLFRVWTLNNLLAIIFGCYVVTLASSRVWQESHTLTAFGLEARTIVLPEHAPQKTFPQFRQWCYKKGSKSNDQRLTAGNTNLAPFDSEIADTRVTCFDCFFVYPLMPRQTLVKILKKIMVKNFANKGIRSSLRWNFADNN